MGKEAARLRFNGLLGLPRVVALPDLQLLQVRLHILRAVAIAF